MELSKLDQKILSFLLKDARMPFLEIARECGVSGAAIHQRVKKMEDRGIICGSSLLVNPRTLGLDVCAFISVSLSEVNKYPIVVDKLSKIPEIVECHFVTGSSALLLKVYCRNNEHLMNLILENIQKTPYVIGTDTMLSLDEAFTRQIRTVTQSQDHQE